MLFLAGVLGGMAAPTKQVGVLSLAGLVTILVLDGRAQFQRRWALKSAAIVLVGSLAAVAVWLLPFFLTSSLDDFYYANVTYNQLYSGEISIGERFANELRGLRYLSFVAAPLVAGTIATLVGVVRGRAAPNLSIPLIFLVAAYAGVAVSGRALPQYYVALLPPLALLSASTVSNALRVSRPSRWTVAAGSVTVLLALAASAPIFLQSTPEGRHTARFNNPVYTEPQNVSAAVGARIAELTGPDDTVFDFGRESQLYFYADRRPAIKFIYDRSFWLDPSTLAESLTALRQAKPRLIVDSVSHRDDPEWEGVFPSELRRLLDESYEYAGRVEFADLYTLKE